MSKGMLEFHPDYAVAPGRIIQEYLEYRGITPEAFAKQAEINGEIFKSILKGAAPLTEEIANKLAPVNNIAPSTWLALDKTYWRKKAKLEKLQK
jgi:plasmid maintenance system antidote protein VapI